MNKMKKTLLWASALTLLPMLSGLMLWNQLPDRMISHWGPGGVPDGTASKGFVVFGLPLLLVAVQWLGTWLTTLDPGNRQQNRKVLNLALWIAPVISILCGGFIQISGLGLEIPADFMIRLLFLLMGMMFVIIGNYLPKCIRNRTIGIKIKWTLDSDANWNATHRLAGRIWVPGGIAIMLCVFLPFAAALWVLPAVFLVMVAVPVLYSWCYYRKQTAAGLVTEQTSSVTPPAGKVISMISGIIAVTAIILAAVLCFTGNVTVDYSDTGFTVQTTYWSDWTVSYDAVDSITYLKSDKAGARISGIGSPRLSVGHFRNDTWGDYTRYTYTGCDAVVVVTVNGQTLVLNGPDTAATQALYNTLVAKIH